MCEALTPTAVPLSGMGAGVALGLPSRRPATDPARAGRRPWRQLSGSSPDMPDGPATGERPSFEEAVLPHLGAAYNLARWLTRDPARAEDVVQTACLRALRFFGGFRGVNARAWLLTIVRNVAFTSSRSFEAQETVSFDEETHGAESSPVTDPELLLLRGADAARLRTAIATLPAVLREALVLRELEGLTYREIADVAQIPIGTVMSRLARARQQLRGALLARPPATRVP
jgi:RNA polymerase sigma-70 factor (ECF subfamily)